MMSRTRATLRGKYWKDYFNSFRYCSACGKKLAPRFVKEEHAKRLVCDSCHRITYLNPKVVAGVIPLLPNGDVVLLQREIEPAKGKWSYPAGYMELGETVEQAAKRETFEEICVKIQIKKCLGFYSYSDAGVVTIVYVGRIRPGSHPKPGIESSQVRVFPRNKIPWKQLAFRSTVDALRDALRCFK